MFVGRLEAAMQRLTNLCSVLNDMEPICVLNHVFVLREVSPYVSYLYGNEITCFVLTSKLVVLKLRPLKPKNILQL